MQMQEQKPVVLSATGTTEYWMKNLDLPSGSETLVETIADDYARDYRAVTEEYAAYGTPLPKEKEIEKLIRLADLQIAAENRLAETLPLTGEQRRRVLQGTGSLMQLEFE
jgi:hypothetical protein